MNDIVQDIMTMPLNEAWEMFVTMNDDVNSNTYLKGRWGNKIKFDIYDHLNNTFTHKGKVGKVIIRGKSVETSDYHSELEIRKKMIKDWLIENCKEKDLYEDRGKE